MNLKIFSFLAIFLSPVLFFGQLNPVKWEAKYNDLGHNEGEIILTATIEKKWHVYSQFISPDAGPVPTSFIFSGAKNFELVGKAQEEGAHEEFVKAFEAKIAVFENKAVFKQKIKRSNLKAFNTVIKLEYMTCNDMQCLPPKTIDLNLAIPEGKK
jgi:hypothetical protein